MLPRMVSKSEQHLFNWRIVGARVGVLGCADDPFLPRTCSGHYGAILVAGPSTGLSAMAAI